MSYDDALTATYRFPAVTLSAAGTIARFTTPKGLKGRIRSIDYVLTTATTVAASNVSVGISGDTGKFATSIVPVTAINLGVSDVTLTPFAGADADGTTGEAVLIDADADVLITSDGGSTAGAADIVVIVDWFK